MTSAPVEGPDGLPGQFGDLVRADALVGTLGDRLPVADALLGSASACLGAPARGTLVDQVGTAADRLGILSDRVPVLAEILWADRTD